VLSWKAQYQALPAKRLIFGLATSPRRLLTGSTLRAKRPISTEYADRIDPSPRYNSLILKGGNKLEKCSFKPAVVVRDNALITIAQAIIEF
jgi:hypothetical protein